MTKHLIIDGLNIDRVADSYNSESGKLVYKYIGSITYANEVGDKVRLQIHQEDVARIVTACLPMFERVFKEGVNNFKENVEQLTKEQK